MCLNLYHGQTIHTIILHGKRISNEEIVIKFVWDEEADESYEKMIIYL